jgi:hypothetical protein
LGTGFFHSLAGDADLGRVPVELSRDGFDQKMLVSGLECRPAKLPNQQQHPGLMVQGKNGGAMAHVVGFPCLVLPTPITAVKIILRLAQHKMPVGQKAYSMEAHGGGNVFGHAIYPSSMCFNGLAYQTSPQSKAKPCSVVGDQSEFRMADGKVPHGSIEPHNMFRTGTPNFCSEFCLSIVVLLRKLINAEDPLP